ERRALEGVRMDCHAFWKLLSVPSPDAAELLARRPTLPELRLPAELRDHPARDVPPVLVVPLPHLGGDCAAALHELRAHVLASDDRTIAEWHETAFSFLARRQGKTTWLERSGGSLAYVDCLSDSWRDARYIHIYRDGVACAWSMAHHPYFRVRVARAAARAAVPIRECLEEHLPVELFGAYWSAVMMRGLRALRRVPRGDVLHISYEKLTTDPTEVLRRVQRFMDGTEAAQEWTAAARGCIRPPAPVARPARETERLRRACRPGMSELARLEADVTN
ncbi:MAG TPA: sulfotransferase, partial [Polyangiaceae bacterium]|nr:sulfotransferase [Polyangiaceae bacterium]